MLATLGAVAPVAHATLGVPTGDVSGPYTSMAAFEAAIGGADNLTTAGEQGGGFRHINWDALAVDGSDPGSTVIESRHVAAVARDRLEPWGIELGPEIAVANDGFNSANNNVDFTPFSPPNVWAPFNSNTAELDVVAPAGAGSTPVPAQTRGVGIMFLNVTAGGTSIEYYNGDIPLLTEPVPDGATSFVGVLFGDPVVTRVVVTLGTAQIFAFNGSHVTPTPSATDFVAGDDVALAEPAAARPAVGATAGVPVTATLDTFTESNPNATPKATIDWGDGSRTSGTIQPAGGGTFTVAGDHAYAQTGSYTARVTVDDSSGPEQTSRTQIQVGPRATATSITCSPPSVAVSAAALCTATVSDVDGGIPTVPTGVVAFMSPTAGVSFAQDGGCLLGPTSLAGVASCSVQFTPGQLPPAQARLAAAYGGDGTHSSSSGQAILGVHAQRCSLKALSRRLRAGGLGVLVTCDARSGIQISATALVARKGPFRAFQLKFGTLRGLVTAGRPTVLVIKPAGGVFPTLRAALRRHQRVSLKLTLTASTRATHRTTTVRVPAIRIG